MPRLVACLVLALELGAAQVASAHSLKELEDGLFKREPFVQFVEQPAPGFTLQDTTGHRVSLFDFRDKVVVLWFIYTNCPDECPLQSEKLAGIQAQIDRTPMRDLVEFVTVTTDPARDTPEALASYGKAHGLNSSNWVFLTSGVDKPTATRELAERYGLKFTPEGDGELMHGVVTQIIDKKGRLRARFHGLKFDDTNLILYVDALTNDYD